MRVIRTARCVAIRTSPNGISVYEASVNISLSLLQDSDIGAEHANTQVSAATVGLSGALSGSTGERETAACSSGDASLVAQGFCVSEVDTSRCHLNVVSGFADTVETVQEAQVSQAAAPQGQSVQLQPQHHVQQHVVCQPLSQGSVEHQADTEQQALHHFAIRYFLAFLSCKSAGGCACEGLQNSTAFDHMRPSPTCTSMFSCFKPAY